MEREPPWAKQQAQQAAREELERSKISSHRMGGDAANAPAALMQTEPMNIPAHIQVPEDFPSISIAIEMAADGDVILIAPGEYRESINLNKDVTLKGHRCVQNSRRADSHRLQLT